MEEWDDTAFRLFSRSLVEKNGKDTKGTVTSSFSEKQGLWSHVERRKTVVEEAPDQEKTRLENHSEFLRSR